MRVKVFDEMDLALQALYNVSTEKPRTLQPYFGNEIKLRLNTNTKLDELRKNKKEQEPEVDLVEPTLLSLARHFGYLNWAYVNIIDLLQQSREIARLAKKNPDNMISLDPRFLTHSEVEEVRNFEMQRVQPLRKALSKQDLYFYCVPGLTIEMDSITGEAAQTTMHRVLCVLPKYVKVAHYYGLEHEALKILAPQVLWVIKYLCAIGTIKTPRQLEVAIDDWPKYITQFLIDKTRTQIFEKNEFLMTRETQLLLPCADPDKI